MMPRDFPVIFDFSVPGRVGSSYPDPDVPDAPLEQLVPAACLRKQPAALPEVSELDVVRHYTRLSHRNFSIDEGFYPLGSCTMKYNPKIHEDAARLPGFARLHPYVPAEHAQGALRLFEERILDVEEIVHGAGGQLYLDGANFNAVLGVTRPGDQGFDVMHMNLHKTFTTPHGGGGPGAGAVGVKSHLAPFMPVPVIEREDERFRFDDQRPQSIGKIRAFYGNFGNLVRAYAYIRSMGAEGLQQVAETAVLNANYLLARLRSRFDLPYDRVCKHEFVLSGARQKRQHGVTTKDMAKRMLDYGFHAPTIYFPLIVEEAIMIEPTETESKRTLDEFADAMQAIAREAQDEPDVVRTAPHSTPVRRLDEVRAARQPDLRWKPR